MSALLLTLLAAWAMLTLAPDTAIGRWLRMALVEVPARRLSAIRQATVIAVILAIAIAGAAWAIDYELLRVISMAVPEAAVWLSMVEVGTLIEVGATALATRTALRLGAMRAAVRSATPRRRSPRTRPAERALPANDDEDRAAAA